VPSRFPLAALLGAFALFACSAVTREFTGNVNFDVEVDSDNARYETLLIINPLEDPRIAEHRQATRAGSIIRMTLALTEVIDGNEAYQVDGVVDLRPEGAGEDAWISGVGRFDRVPLYNGDPATGMRGTPAVNPPQRITLDLDVSTLGRLSELIFEEQVPRLELRIRGTGRDEAGVERGPVRVRFAVEVTIRGIAGL
jgi:hypothetical protein